MTELASTAERQSECTRCPAWVVRCAHFEGRVLTLIDNDAAREAHGAVCHGRWAGKALFSVLLRPDNLVPCRTCGEGPFLATGSGHSSGHPDLASAEAEFLRLEAEAEARRREAELLGETQ